MDSSSGVDAPASDDEIGSLASEFENRDFTPAELATIRKTRRRSPRQIVSGSVDEGAKMGF